MSDDYNMVDWQQHKFHSSKYSQNIDNLAVNIGEEEYYNYQRELLFDSLISNKPVYFQPKACLGKSAKESLQPLVNAFQGILSLLRYQYIGCFDFNDSLNVR